jgi:hypothetical protein
MDPLPTSGFSKRGAFEGDWIAMSILLVMVFALLIWMGTPGGPLVGCTTCQGNVAKFFSSGNTSTSWMIYLVVPLAVLSFVRNLADRISEEDESGVGELLRQLDQVAPRQGLKEGINVFRFREARAQGKRLDEQVGERQARGLAIRQARIDAQIAAEQARLAQVAEINKFREGIEEGRGEAVEFEARGRRLARLEAERARVAAAQLGPTDISQLGVSLAPNPVLTRAEVANLRRRGMTDSEIAAMQGIALRRFEQSSGRRLQGSLIVAGHRTAAGAIIPPVGSAGRLRAGSTRSSLAAKRKIINKLSQPQAKAVNRSMNANFLRSKKRKALQ